MDYDVEREKQSSEEIRKAFREIFPLAAETDLPWAVCHIKNFLRDRIGHEVEEGTQYFVSQISRVLCEVTPPKTHLVDMVRNVVDKAKKADQLALEVAELRKELEKLKAKP